MKTKNFKKPIALFLAVMLCASLLFSLGTTAFAAEETANVCLIAFPRDGDVNYSGEWGHGNLNFMNGWSTKASAFTLIRAMGQYAAVRFFCLGDPRRRGAALFAKTPLRDGNRQLDVYSRCRTLCGARLYHLPRYDRRAIPGRGCARSC